MPEKTFPTPKEKQTEAYWKELNKVIDPELGFGVVDLGLIYAVEIDKDKKAKVTMTLTTPTCPVGPYLIKQVENTMRRIKNIKDVNIIIVWDPMWTEDRIDEEIREMIIGI